MARATKEEIEKAIVHQVVDSEFKSAKANVRATDEMDDFESYIDMLDSVRSEKDVDWRSDISLPEFASQMLTQSAIDVNQMFATRDFVEVYLQDASDAAKKISAAAKECINRTLNQKHMHHYQKYTRAKLCNHLIGRVYMRCWWEQEFHDVKVGQQEIFEQGKNGEAIGTGEFEDVTEQRMKFDRFNYDVIDPRNVFMDNEYVYTLQDKRWVIVRYERTIQQLEAEKNIMGYINLNKVRNSLAKRPAETETSRETYNKEDSIVREDNPVNKPMDILERHGKFWAIVEETDLETGAPTKARPGVGRDGSPTDKAKLIECIVSFAISDGMKQMIRFQPAPYLDGEGNPYRPLIRGLCYIHPSSDGGSGDGKYSRELQVAINDTFNLGQDRLMMATIPVMKAKRSALENTDTVRFEPDHVMELDNPDDVVEMRVDGNITPAMNQITFLSGKMRAVTALDSGAQGLLPKNSSTTATAVATASDRTDIRTNYKSMSFEHTALVPLYTMIINMTKQFAKPETGIKLMGDKVENFDPTKNFFFKPVSGSIETEQSKSAKIGLWTNVLQSVMGIQHPDTVNLANSILEDIFTLMGKEQEFFAKSKLNPQTPIQSQGGQQAPQSQGPPVSNQNGNTQSQQEQIVRDQANA
ncbi:MAG: hypothetical protein ACE5DX_05620 [Candidatus Dojkabacteria bacterium]